MWMPQTSKSENTKSHALACFRRHCEAIGESRPRFRKVDQSTPDTGPKSSHTPSTKVQVWVHWDFKHVVYGYSLTLAIPLVLTLTNHSENGQLAYSLVHYAGHMKTVAVEVFEYPIIRQPIPIKHSINVQKKRPYYRRNGREWQSWAWPRGLGHCTVQPIAVRFCMSRVKLLTATFMRVLQTVVQAVLPTEWLPISSCNTWNTIDTLMR